MRINAAPDSLVTAEFTVSVTLAHGDVQQGRIDLLSLNFNEDAAVPATFLAITNSVLDDIAGNGVTLKLMNLAPLTEAEARHNIFSQLWFELTNLSGGEVILDEARVVLIGYAAAPLPNGFVRTDPPALVTSGDVTVKDKDGVTIASVFELTTIEGAEGAAGPPGVLWRDDVNGGTWQTGTAYAEDDGVRNGDPSSSYRCYVAHTAGALTEPGVGADWATVWKLLAERGDDGADGAPGDDGADGVGVPTGGTTGQVLAKASNANYDTLWVAAGSGDMVGPASSTDNAIVRFNGTTGKLAQDSAAIVGDDGSITLPEMAAPAAPPAGRVVIYPKADGKLYIKDDAGTETDLTASTGGSASLNEKTMLFTQVYS